MNEPNQEKKHSLPYFKCEQCPDFETEWKLKADVHGRKRKDKVTGEVTRHKVYRINPPKQDNKTE
jgi:hypothetical protein